MDDEGDERGFKGVWFTASLWLNKKLNWTEKALIAEVDGLCRHDSPCHAGVEHLAERLNLAPGSIANMLSELTRDGHLVQLGSDGRHVWRCAAPQYWQDPGMVQKWEKRFAGRFHRLVISGLSDPLSLTSPDGDTELPIELPGENLRSSHKASLSEKNSDHGSFSQAKKEKKQRLTVEFVLNAVRPDLTLQSPLFAAAWKRWVEYRLQVRNPSVPGFQLNMAKFAVMGQTRAIAAIDNSIGNGYQGIFEDKTVVRKYSKPEPSL